MTVTAETIESYFDQYGWTYEQLDETHFLTGFSSDVVDSFAIYITLTPNWVYFAITPFVEAPQDPQCERRLYGHLLRLCQQINMAKFAVDSDGDVSGLVPLLIEGGVTGLYPFEVTGASNIVNIRRDNPGFQILGGLDKKAVASGREAIDRELEEKVPELLKSGGYIPFIDHTVPPDISWDDFCYYRQRLTELSTRS